MSMFDKTVMDRVAGPSVRIAALLGAVLALSVSLSLPATGSQQDGELVPTAMRPKTGTAANDAARGYELRCWQKGRLILEEQYLRAPPESSSDALRMTDTAGRPVRVLETANATCLLKAVPMPPRALRP